ncbi:3219_t:CDS:10 [Entrophospora sp. SA101]|nr:3219_t:CDS:10 [Entrophospora sp. SA101]
MAVQSYDVAVSLFNMILDIFFREIRPRNSHKIPKEGPIIFVAAPHANQVKMPIIKKKVGSIKTTKKKEGILLQMHYCSPIKAILENFRDLCAYTKVEIYFVDPLILMRHCQRRVSFLIAEKSMRRRFIGTMARALNAIPVIRPQDLKRSGKGRIQLLNRKSEPTHIIGMKTEFTKQLKVGWRISLPQDLGSSEVLEIISDTELLLKKEIKDLRALEVLTCSEGTAYYCVPCVDQSKVYNAVFERLNAGHCIGIFPEGGSHDRTEILPLKAGVTVMALGAIVANPKLDVKIVPCGLNYFHAHSFRSRAVVEFGEPISIPNDLVEKFKEGGPSKREACSKLLETIYDGLKSVTVNTPDYETLMFIQAGRRLYKPAHRRLPISGIVELNRRFIYGYEHFKNDPRVEQMRKEIMSYDKLLKYHGLKDHQVNKTVMGGYRAAGLFFYRVMLLTTWSILGLPGFILNLPIVLIARKISDKKAKEAVLNSSIKIAGRDVLATWKLLVALVVTPIAYGFYTFVVVIISIRKKWILKWKVVAPIVTFCTLVTGSYATMRILESGVDIYKTSIQNLRVVREQLSSNLTNLINELAPQLYPDFDVERIIQATERSSSSPLSSLSKSIFQPPIDWIDDMLFNSGDISEYDDVLYFLEKRNGSVSAGRSRASSIASGQSSRQRSRTVSSEAFRVEAFTKLPKDKLRSKKF